MRSISVIRLVLEAASVSYGKATPYFPIVDLLTRYMHIEDGDEPRTIPAVWDKALEYCRQAGEKAMTRSTYHEAEAYVEQALEPLHHLPERQDTRAQAINLRLALCSALLPSNDSGRILAYLCEAEILAMALDNHRQLGRISGYLSVHFRSTGAYDQAAASAQRAWALATAGGDSAEAALANLYLDAACWARGEYRQAIDYLRQTTTSLQRIRYRDRLSLANQ